jgi:hypothetical protein
MPIFLHAREKHYATGPLRGVNTGATLGRACAFWLDLAFSPSGP